ncbi:hypothetical protein [Pelagibacterium luteolum]|uniref:Uncharacterized protein n=1 Tax=Pelagibacterium luteolum TaxID=440168 RepID=A0A1G7TG86_9HYPH|nr:hypothetical protein [Pelagibacterium luteolum]SDG34377.1 hypothetical protein SAMN04487974_102115 [Pelagibacterium luteolum]
MAKANIAQWDTTAGSNTDINDISLAENVMKPPAVNNAFRETMAQIAQWTSEGTIASATTCDIGAQDEEFLNVTGTTTITSFGTVRAGTKRTLLFAGALTITHNGTSLILASGENFVTAAGDILTFISEGGGNWRQLVDSSRLAKDGANIGSVTERGTFLSNIGAGVLSGFRNKIINGDFVVNVNNAAATLQKYVIDRWYHDWNGSGIAPTVSRQNHTPGQTAVPGNPSFFLRMDQGSAPSGQSASKLLQRIEDAGTLAGETATFTIYLKAAANLTLPGLYIIQNFGAGGGTGSKVVVASSLSLTTSWQKFTFTVDVPSVTGGLLGSETWLEYGIDLPLNSTWTIDISHASLVSGDATGETDAFAARHIQQEVAMCQRYFQTIYGEERWDLASTSENNMYTIAHPTKMRTTPSSSVRSQIVTVNIADYTLSPRDATSSALSITGGAVGGAQLQAVFNLDSEL